MCVFVASPAKWSTNPDSQLPISLDEEVGIKINCLDKSSLSTAKHLQAWDSQHDQVGASGRMVESRSSKHTLLKCFLFFFGCGRQKLQWLGKFDCLRKSGPGLRLSPHSSHKHCQMPAKAHVVHLVWTALGKCERSGGGVRRAGVGTDKISYSLFTKCATSWAPSSNPQTWFQLACLSKPLHSITPLLTPFGPSPPHLLTPLLSVPQTHNQYRSLG